MTYVDRVSHGPMCHQVIYGLTYLREFLGGQKDDCTGHLFIEIVCFYSDLPPTQISRLPGNSGHDGPWKESRYRRVDPWSRNFHSGPTGDRVDGQVGARGYLLKRTSRVS